MLFKYAVDTAGVMAFEKFTQENVRASKDMQKDMEFKFESESQQEDAHSLPSGGSIHRQRKRIGPNIHPDAARTLHDIVFTRLKHSHSFHKDEEAKQPMISGATGEDIQVVVIDERPEKFNIYNDGDRLLNTYYSNLP